jgi:hypothetical protein
MGIVAKAFRRLVAACERKAGCLRAEPVIEGYAAQLRQSRGQERSAFQIGEIDRQRGAGASIAVRRAETKHDHGGLEWEGHEVSQENGCGLQERGTTAIRRMVPPQSGQMAKSAAVSGESPRV